MSHDGSPAAKPTVGQMAASAATSAVQFAASGGKLVSSTIRKARIETCRACDQLSGPRCQACGCFIAAKTWLPHEKCPLGKWQS